jgi:hypothetical protein
MGLLDDPIFKRPANKEIDRQIKGGKGNDYTGSKPEEEEDAPVRRRPPIYKTDVEK